MAECDIDVIRGFIMYHPFSDESTISANYKFLTTHHEDSFSNYIRQLGIYYNTKIYWYCKEKNILGPEYSYLNSTSYLFQNEYIQKVDDFLKSLQAFPN